MINYIRQGYYRESSARVVIAGDVGGSQMPYGFQRRHIVDADTER